MSRLSGAPDHHPQVAFRIDMVRCLTIMNARDPYRIPPASALIAFESAVRHANFTLAARELRTSQAAVSRQIHREGWPSAARFFSGVLTEKGRRKPLARKCLEFFDWS